MSEHIITFKAIPHVVEQDGRYYPGVDTHWNGSHFRGWLIDKPCDTHDEALVIADQFAAEEVEKFKRTFEAFKATQEAK